MLLFLSSCGTYENGIEEQNMIKDIVYGKEEIVDKVFDDAKSFKPLLLQSLRDFFDFGPRDTVNDAGFAWMAVDDLLDLLR